MTWEASDKWLTGLSAVRNKEMPDSHEIYTDLMKRVRVVAALVVIP